MKRSILKVVLSTALLTSVGFSSELSLNGSKVEFSKHLSLHSLNSLSVEDSDALVVIKTKDSLSKDQKETLYHDGARSIVFAGINSYYVLASKDDIENIVNESDFIVGASVVSAKYKIDKSLKNVNINDEIKLKVVFMNSVSKDEIQQLLQANNIEFSDFEFNGEFQSATLKVMGIDIERLASLSVVKEVNKYHKIGIIKPLSAKVENNDIDINQAIGATSQVVVDEDLDGVNIPVAVVDEGRVRKSHQEFRVGLASRVRDRVSSAGYSLHSTHVTGIIAAAGVNSYAKALASAAQVYTYSYQDKNTIGFFASSMSALASSGIYVSNHSYGYPDKVGLQAYDSDAASEDSVVYNNPKVIVFMAAGNDRAYEGYPDVGCIKGAANAKNIFTIGALNSSSSDVAYYSSTGPVYDGRIKPDLVVRGSYVYSTSTTKDNGYAYMTGTSMATPAALSASVLVMQEYKKLTNCGDNKGCDMTADLLKAVLVNTADDKNAIGPDVYTGYGMINVQKAIETVKTLKNDKREVNRENIGRGAIKEYSFSTSTTKSFKATLSWVDPAGNSASSSKSLVNDLDVYLVNTDNNTKYYPYSLNRSNPTAPAYHDRKNSVDNTEKIEVANLPAGNYKLVVDASNISTSSQKFALATSEAIFDRGEGLIPTTQKVKLEMNNFAKIMMNSIY